MEEGKAVQKKSWFALKINEVSAWKNDGQFKEYLDSRSGKCPDNFIDDIKIEHIKNHLPEAGIIVEIGAGSGQLLTQIAIRHPEYQPVGLDFTNCVAGIAKNFLDLNISGEGIRADAYHLPLKDNSVVMVMSGGLLEHFKSGTEINSIVREMVRVLKPNGIFYADIVPRKSSLCRPIIIKKDTCFENSIKKDEWKKIFEKNKLKDVKVFSGLVIPPNFYNWFKKGTPQLNLIYKVKQIILRFDDTIISDILGFEYFVFARK